MIGDLISAAFTSGSAGAILGFLGAEAFRVMVADFSRAGRKTFSSTNEAAGNFVLPTCDPCSATDRPLVPLPIRRPMCPGPVSPNSMASITPLLPAPFGPDIAVPLPKSMSSLRMPRTSSMSSDHNNRLEDYPHGTISRSFIRRRCGSLVQGTSDPGVWGCFLRK